MMSEQNANQEDPRVKAIHDYCLAREWLNEAIDKVSEAVRARDEAKEELAKAEKEVIGRFYTADKDGSDYRKVYLNLDGELMLEIGSRSVLLHTMESMETKPAQ